VMKKDTVFPSTDIRLDCSVAAEWSAEAMKKALSPRLRGSMRAWAP